MFGNELVEKLIDEVEKRPVLYNKQCCDFTDTNLKAKKWDEVTIELIGKAKWEEMSAAEKKNASNETQKRWISLRCCFNRELKTQKEIQLGKSRKKRPYIYFQRLMFINSKEARNMDSKEAGNMDSTEEENMDSKEAGNMDSKEEGNMDSKEAGNMEESDDDDGLQSTDTEPTNAPCSPVNNDKTIESLLQSIQSKDNGTNSSDEDHYFALSLVPMLRRLSDYDKLDVKMQILNVFKRFTPQPERMVHIIKSDVDPIRLDFD